MILTLLAAALVGVGCGSGTSQSQSDPESGNQAVQSAEGVAADDVATVLQAEDSINTACGLVKNEQGSDIPVDRAIQMMQSVYRENPDATYAAGTSYRPRNMKTVVRDNAQTLRSCGRVAQAQRLASVLQRS